MVVVFLIILTLEASGVLAAEVNLRVYGPHNPDFIALCPDLDYVVSVECSVTDGTTLEWKLNPVLRQTARFTADGMTGEYPRQTSVTIILSKSDPIKSQFQVSSSVLRNAIIDQGEPLTIVCLNSPTENSTMPIRLSGGDPPVITSVNDDQSSVDVTWSTNIPDIVNIAVIAKSEDGIESSVVVGPDVRNAKVYIVPNTLYNVTVVVFDICKQNYSSQPEPIGRRLETSSTILQSSSIVLEPSVISTSPDMSLTERKLTSSVFVKESPELSARCDENDGGAVAIALGILLPIVILCLAMTIIMIVYMIIHYRKKVTETKTLESDTGGQELTNISDPDEEK